jgi:uncharacterized repeat protein (TIGR01451 family)
LGVPSPTDDNGKRYSPEEEEIEMNKRIVTLVLALAMTVAILAAGAAQAQVQSTSLLMTANPDSVAVGEPVTFTITKTNSLPSDRDWSVRDHLPAEMEFDSAASSQGTCNFLADSNVVRCDLGIIPSGESATMYITVVPTVAGKITNYAADTGENLTSATVMVE